MVETQSKGQSVAARVCSQPRLLSPGLYCGSHSREPGFDFVAEMPTYVHYLSHSLWIGDPDVPSLINESVLAIEHPGERFSGKIRANRRSEFRDYLMKSKIFLPNPISVGTWTPGRSQCFPL